MATIPPEMLSFLRRLAQNNDRDWFNEHKQEYLEHVKEPALAFIADFAVALQEISPHYQAVPKAQGGSLFRIYRDVRFSKDKTPYKTHTGMQFRHAQASRDVHAPGFYLHIEPGESAVGVGVWRAPNPALRKIRARIDAEPEVWEAIKSPAQTAGLSFMTGKTDLKRVPRGYPEDHPHAEDLKRKTIALSRPLSDETLLQRDFDRQLAGIFADGAPLVAFLCQSLDLPF